MRPAVFRRESTALMEARGFCCIRPMVLRIHPTKPTKSKLYSRRAENTSWRSGALIQVRTSEPARSRSQYRRLKHEAASRPVAYLRRAARFAGDLVWAFTLNAQTP